MQQVGVVLAIGGGKRDSLVPSLIAMPVCLEMLGPMRAGRWRRSVSGMVLLSHDMNRCLYACLHYVPQLGWGGAAIMGLCHLCLSYAANSHGCFQASP